MMTIQEQLNKARFSTINEEKLKELFSTIEYMEHQFAIEALKREPTNEFLNRVYSI